MNSLTRKALFSILFSVVISLTNLALAENDSPIPKVAAATPAFQASEILNTYKIERIGFEKVTIWKDMKKTNRFFYPPSVLPDWKAFNSAADNACSNDSRKLPTTYRIKAPIYLSDEHYEQDIRDAIKADKTIEASVRTKMKIGAIPHDNIQIALTVPGYASQIVVETKNVARDKSFKGLAISYTYPSATFMEIAGTCKLFNEIKAMVARNDVPLSGKIYVLGVEYDTSFMSGIVTQELVRRTSTKIFGSESLVRSSKLSSNANSKQGTGNSALMSLVLGSGKDKAKGISTSTNAQSSRQRLLNRNFLNNIYREVSTSLSGFCTAATDSGCGTEFNSLTQWLTSNMKPISLTIVGDEAGGAALIKDQVTYATLSPAEFKTVLKTAPSIENSSENTNSKESGTTNSKEGEKSSSDTSKQTSSNKEKAVVKDDITWDVSGSEPIPTNVHMILADDLQLGAAASVEWYNNTPIKDSSGIYVISLNYPVFAYAKGNILSPEQIQKKKKLSLQCRNQQLSKPLNARNLVRYGSSKKGDRRNTVSATFNSFSDLDSSRRCKNEFDFKWVASPGHFFLTSGFKPLRFSKQEFAYRSFNAGIYGGKFFHRKGRLGFDSGYPLTRNAPGNVNLANGSPQAILEFDVRGYANGDYGSTDDTCGITMNFSAKQYPFACMPYLIKGYVE